MTAQEVFYYTVSACAWIFMMMMVVVFYRINQVISRCNQMVGVIESIPKTIRGVVVEIITFLIEKIGPASARVPARQGGDEDEG
jgi:hypothetical protein